MSEKSNSEPKPLAWEDECFEATLAGLVVSTPVAAEKTLSKRRPAVVDDETTLAEGNNQTTEVPDDEEKPVSNWERRQLRNIELYKAMERRKRPAERLEDETQTEWEIRTGRLAFFGY